MSLAVWQHLHIEGHTDCVSATVMFLRIFSREACRQDLLSHHCRGLSRWSSAWLTKLLTVVRQIWLVLFLCSTALL